MGCALPPGGSRLTITWSAAVEPGRDRRRAAARAIDLEQARRAHLLAARDPHLVDAVPVLRQARDPQDAPVAVALERRPRTGRGSTCAWTVVVIGPVAAGAEGVADHAAADRQQHRAQRQRRPREREQPAQPATAVRAARAPARARLARAGGAASARTVCISRSRSCRRRLELLDRGGQHLDRRLQPAGALLAARAALDVALASRAPRRSVSASSR